MGLFSFKVKVTHELRSTQTLKSSLFSFIVANTIEEFHYLFHFILELEIIPDVVN